jgi:DNA helicase IV
MGRRTVSGNLQDEQSFVDEAHRLLGDYVAHLRHRIESTKRAPGTGTGQDEIEREALLDNLNQQVQAAEAATSKVCFGRIFRADDTSHHVGRIGLRSDDGEVVLLDWRAPQAAPFYQATAQDPQGLLRRRRIATRTRIPTPEVTHVDDEYFGADALLDADPHHLVGASAMQAPRTGRMADILASIAADQDAIIRSPLEQITVVEGGPGTGKTVVALHRAAWLLYTYRDKLSRDAVLIVGPSNVFLRYIDQVLPSLGETDVVLLTPAQFYPNVQARRQDAAHVARIKGDVRMARVVEAAIAARVRLPETELRLTTTTGTRVRLSPSDIQSAARGISRSHHFHAGREPFLKRLLQAAARNIARDRGHDPDDQDYCQDIVLSLVEDSNVRREFNLMWLPTTPERVITGLLSDESRMAAAADGILNRDEQRALLRSADSDWTTDDIPLLDEAAFLLGPWSPPAAVEADEGYRELQASDAYRVKPDRTSSRGVSVAERAIEDREWVYGHVIVDEAQELSAMAWRCVRRRASRKSMTVVGDLQQSSHPASPRSWQDVLSWGVDKVHLHTLTVTYRITRQIAEAATELLTAAGGRAPVLTPIRDGAPVTRRTLSIEEIADYVRGVTTSEGRNAVIVPNSLHNDMRRVLSDAQYGFDDEAIDSPVAVLTVQQAKGLEFDSVILIGVAELSTQHDRGADVYVAATRATQTLHLVDIVEQ